MKYGFVLPGGSAPEQLEQAVIAERAGWDGVFVWEAAYGVDPWTLLAAMAAKTTRVQARHDAHAAALATPLEGREPGRHARPGLERARDHLGRARRGRHRALGSTGEELDTARRAEMLDEGIDLMRGFWEGNLRFEGKHYAADLSPRADIAENARPVQSRIPIWVVGAWRRPKSMRRVLRCDGILPNLMGPEGIQELTPAAVRDIRAWLNEHGARPDFDIVAGGRDAGRRSGGSA